MKLQCYEILGEKKHKDLLKESVSFALFFWFNIFQNHQMAPMQITLLVMFHRGSEHPSLPSPCQYAKKRATSVNFLWGKQLLAPGEVLDAEWYNSFPKAMPLVQFFLFDLNLYRCCQ